MDDMNEIECWIDMKGSCLRCLVYSYDQVNLGSSANELQQMMDYMIESFKANGMKLNERKIIVFGKVESMTLCNIAIEDENVRQVKEFVYLSNMFK